MVESYVDHEVVLAQFNRLMQELLRGTMQRNAFRPWEIELLLDIETCQVKDGQRRDVLRRYQKAAAKQMEKQGGMPMKLSEYLDHQRSRKLAIS
jgi:hypothetical protein